MASGLPDYYRGVDITYQTLAEVTNRPKYGGAITSAGSVVVGANAQTGVISIAGKGMIYGGVLFLDGEFSQKDSQPMLIVDDVNLNHATFFQLNEYGINIPRGHSPAIAVYDDVNFIYSVEFLYGITFESSVSIKYNEGHGDTPSVKGQLAYALI